MQNKEKEREISRSFSFTVSSIAMYYPLRYQLDSKVRYLLWHSDTENPDRVHLDAQGYIPIFISLKDMLEYSRAHGLQPIDGEEPIPNNLDAIKRWLKRKRPTSIDYADALNAWNLFGDVSHSLDGDFDRDHGLTNKIYYKIFWGSNIEALTPKGQMFIPTWTAHEIKIMHSVLRHGLQMFRDHVRLQR